GTWGAAEGRARGRRAPSQRAVSSDSAQAASRLRWGGNVPAAEEESDRADRDEPHAEDDHARERLLAQRRHPEPQGTVEAQEGGAARRPASARRARGPGRRRGRPRRSTIRWG